MINYFRVLLDGYKRFRVGPPETPEEPRGGPVQFQELPGLKGSQRNHFRQPGLRVRIFKLTIQSY